MDDIAALRELWLELHHHHAQVAPQSGEFVDDASSWRVRSSSYREWLADPRSFLLPWLPAAVARACPRGGEVVLTAPEHGRDVPARHGGS